MHEELQVLPGDPSRQEERNHGVAIQRRDRKQVEDEENEIQIEEETQDHRHAPPNSFIPRPNQVGEAMEPSWHEDIRRQTGADQQANDDDQPNRKKGSSTTKSPGSRPAAGAASR